MARGQAACGVGDQTVRHALWPTAVNGRDGKKTVQHGRFATLRCCCSLVVDRVRSLRKDGHCGSGVKQTELAISGGSPMGFDVGLQASAGRGFRSPSH